MARQALKWPSEARGYYIKFFRLQERLRAHLKMAQEVARQKRLISLKKELTDPEATLSNIYDLLPAMQDTLEGIAAIRKKQIDAVMASGNTRTGRHPNWFVLTLELTSLTRDIAEIMPLIVLDAGRLQDVGAITKTTRALKIANQIREKQLSLPLDQAEIGLDEHGLETIIDLSPVTHILDLNSWQLNTIRSTK